jgi:hypothetical protein
MDLDHPSEVTPVHQQPCAVDRASLGDQRIATQFNKSSRRIRLSTLDREDGVQSLHVELCESLGPAYREMLGIETPGFWTSTGGETLVRCADRVVKQIRDAWKKKARFRPFDEACSGEAETVAETTVKEMSEIKDKLPADERRILIHLLDGHKHAEIKSLLNIKKSNYSNIKRRLYLNLASKLTTPIRG